MKRIKIATITLLATCGLIVTFAFTRSNRHHPPIHIYFGYTSSNNVISFTDPNHLVVSELKDSTANWLQDEGSSGVNGGSRLESIRFDAGEGTLGQAVKAVGDYYNLNHTLPANQGSINGTGFGGLSFAIRIYRSS